MNQRYYSLDVFRGATVALMILVNNPGSWSYIYAPFDHASWNGCTPTDLVFPFFLFAVGNAMSFVMPRFEQAGTIVFLKKVIKRSIFIFAIGLFLNWSPFFKWQDNQLVFKNWDTIRIMGVLQRISLCYFLASVIVFFAKIRGSFVFGVVLLLLYWFICQTAGSIDDPFSLDGYFGTAIDVRLLGEKHMYKGEGRPFDPEGLASTLPAIVQVVFGYLVGQYIQQKGKSYEMLTNLFIAGAVLTAGGLCWSMVFPLNKKIWSSSYVLYTTGLAIFTLSSLIFLIEFKSIKGGITRFFDVFGKNPLFIFVLSGFLPRLLGLIRIVERYDSAGNPVYLSPLGWFYEHICKPLSSNPKNGSLLYAVMMILFYWLIVYMMDRKKIYIKV